MHWKPNLKIHSARLEMHYCGEVMYSGKKIIWFCMFAHWQRNDQSIILMVGLFEHEVIEHEVVTNYLGYFVEHLFFRFNQLNQQAGL